ncbi:MAG: peptidoglycan-binding protein [Clostridia bacterium]|nr:peptidoglycan-binding protein [Clostridia bacterium]
MQTLEINDNGSLVEMIQLSLSRAGFFDSAVDGIFGPVTQRAVVDFQNSFGLPADGIVGINTWDKLSVFIKGYCYKSLGFKLIPTNISYSYELVKNLTDGLKKRYSFITADKIGSSTMGKDLPLLVIGNGNKNLFITAAFHANEWITIPIILKFAEEYLEAYSKGKTIAGQKAEFLFNNVTLHIAPLVNPDGVDLVTGALQQGEFYANAVKISNDFKDIPFPSGWKANILGTDLNLQFPARWKTAKAIKYAQGFSQPAPRDFVGFAPLETNEAKAIYNYTAANSFDMILAYHTQGKEIYWKFADFLPHKSKEIAESLSCASGYELEITPDFAANAGYKDWFIQTFNKPGYTIEAGIGESPLPLSQFDEIYSANEHLIVRAMKETIERI